MLQENSQTKVLYNTKYLQLKSAVSPCGKDWIYAHRPNADNVVVIVPLILTDGGKQILFIRERRPPLYAEGRSKYNIGLPAGLVGDERKGESILDAINAELIEETGLVADTIEIAAHNISSSAGCTSETATIAIATITDPNPHQQPVSDGGVLIERIRVDLQKVPEFIHREQKLGCSVSGQTLAGLYLLTCRG